MTEQATGDQVSSAARIDRRTSVWAFAAMDTAEPLSRRLRALAESRRPMTLIKRLLGSDSSLEVHSDLWVATRDEAHVPVVVWGGGGLEEAGMKVECSPGMRSWGFKVHASRHPSESEVAARFHSEDHPDRRRDLTRVVIHGWPDTRSAQVLIEHWGHDGIGYQTVVTFAPLPDEEDFVQAQAEAVEALARSRQDWTPAGLLSLAATMRWDCMTAADVMATPREQWRP